MNLHDEAADTAATVEFTDPAELRRLAWQVLDAAAWLDRDTFQPKRRRRFRLRSR
jgi:hypothetical protein